MNNTQEFTPENPYFSLNLFCKEKFGERIARIPLTLHQPCPNRINGKSGCIFCLPEAYEPPPILSSGNVAQQIQNFINLRAKFYKAKKYIAYLQSGSSTAGNPDFLKTAYYQALEFNDIIALSISTRPDCLPNEILDIIANLTEQHEIWVELGVQSAHDKTLKIINRGHNNETSLEAIEKLKAAGVQHIVAHLIFGLPGETENDMLETVKIFSGSGINGFKFHHLQVNKNTPLEKLWRENSISLFSVNDYIKLIVKIVEIIPQNIVLHRLIGSSHNNFLLAPKWNLSKAEILAKLHNEFKTQNTFQGKFSILNP